MNQSDALRVMEAYREFEAGECIKAVKGLREFADRIDDPWTKAELLYHQIVFLAQMDDAVHARSCFNELKTAVGFLLRDLVLDTSDDTPPANLAVMVRYAELKTLLAERNEGQALRYRKTWSLGILLNFRDLASRYLRTSTYIMGFFWLMLADGDRRGPSSRRPIRRKHGRVLFATILAIVITNLVSMTAQNRSLWRRFISVSAAIGKVELIMFWA